MYNSYYNKYKKYKHKYLQIKHEQKGGSQKIIKHYKTKNGNYISYTEVPYGNIDKNEFTKEMRKPDKTKILYIDSDFLFDIFTNKYGDIYPYYNQYFEYPDINYHSIYINWEKVAKDFKGFYLDRSNKNFYLSKHSYATFKKIRLSSWWIREYDNFGPGVIMFE